MPDLSGIWAKFEWAREHSEAIDTTFETFLAEEDPYGVSHQMESDGWYRFRWIVSAEPPLRDLALLYGDFLYNLRASLNYLVWQLVLAGERVAPTHEHAFPCVKKEANWRSAVGQQLKGIDQPWIEAIRDLQPFNATKGGDDPNLHWLGILDHVNNINKHRLPTAAVWKLDAFRHRIVFNEPTSAREVPFTMPDGPVEHGAELMSHQLLEENFKVYVDAPPTVQIVFPDGLNHAWDRPDLIEWVRSAITVFEPAFPR